MAAGPSKSFSTKSLECDEEFSEFCENFSFSDTVRNYILNSLSGFDVFYFPIFRRTVLSATATTDQVFASQFAVSVIRSCFTTKVKLRSKITT